MTVAVTVDHLVKHFGSVKAVDGVTFSVEQGEIFGFLGPNGAGKTTTIRCIMGFLRLSGGAVRLFGLDSSTDGVEARRRVGYMPPTTALNEKWTGREHVDYLGKLRGSIGRADNLAQRMELDLDRKVKHLSTGNKQKLSLVLAFMCDADLIVLDEPTTGLDPLLQQTVYDIIDETHRRGATVFMSSHNLAEVEKTCTRVGILRDGTLIAVETMSSLQDKHLYHVVLQFDRDVDRKQFALSNGEVVEASSRQVTLKYHGDIQPLLDMVTKSKPHDVAINHATLEEHFMEFYNHA